jgi:hypothetical protein
MEPPNSSAMISRVPFVPVTTSPFFELALHGCAVAREMRTYQNCHQRFSFRRPRPIILLTSDFRISRVNWATFSGLNVTSFPEDMSLAICRSLSPEKWWSVNITDFAMYSSDVGWKRQRSQITHAPNFSLPHLMQIASVISLRPVGPWRRGSISAPLQSCTIAAGECQKGCHGAHAQHR